MVILYGKNTSIFCMAIFVCVLHNIFVCVNFLCALHSNFCMGKMLVIYGNFCACTTQ